MKTLEFSMTNKERALEIGKQRFIWKNLVFSPQIKYTFLYEILIYRGKTKPYARCASLLQKS